MHVMYVCMYVCMYVHVCLFVCVACIMCDPWCACAFVYTQLVYCMASTTKYPVSRHHIKKMLCGSQDWRLKMLYVIYTHVHTLTHTHTRVATRNSPTCVKCTVFDSQLYINRTFQLLPRACIHLSSSLSLSVHKAVCKCVCVSVYVFMLPVLTWTFSNYTHWVWERETPPPCTHRSWTSRHFVPLRELALFSIYGYGIFIEPL